MDRSNCSIAYTYKELVIPASVHFCLLMIKILSLDTDIVLCDIHRRCVACCGKKHRKNAHWSRTIYSS